MKKKKQKTTSYMSSSRVENPGFYVNFHFMLTSQNDCHRDWHRVQRDISPAFP